MDPRHIHVDSADLNKWICRVTAVDRLVEWFHEGIENFLLRATTVLGSDERVGFGCKEQLYGQRWTLHRETDAMWRIYAPEKNGVRSRTRLKALIASLYDLPEVEHPSIS